MATQSGAHAEKNLAELSPLEKSVLAHRDELKNRRASSPNSKPSHEEEIWDMVLSRLSNQRITEEASQNEKHREFVLSNQQAFCALLLLIAITVAGVVVPSLIGNDMREDFTYLAISATLMGVIAAGCGLWAHEGSKAVDLLGKGLWFSSAIIATYAAFVLNGLK
ncbi:hypothetical protein [Glutamicibacter sp. JC586]|uniref:hypothetical protein n=1 Tax=Glutamicibacter sp. JC586 TaxID=2590552 RepID=UPI00135803AF|nr:hypothetical protein [Glutamicibacter sp. JC586]